MSMKCRSAPVNAGLFAVISGLRGPMDAVNSGRTVFECRSLHVALGDVLDPRRRVGQQCPDFPYLLVIELGLAPARPPGHGHAQPSSPPGSAPESGCARTGQGREHMQLQLARGAARVDLLPERDDFPLAKACRPGPDSLACRGSADNLRRWGLCRAGLPTP